MEKSNKKKGASLIIVLMVLAIAMILSSAALTTISRTTKANVKEKKSEDLLYSAESGLQYGILMFKNKNDVFNKIERTINNCLVNITSEKSGEDYKITSEAKQAERSRKVSVIIKKTSNEIKEIPTAIFGINKIVLKRGVKGSIGTNSTDTGAITLDWGFRIDGDVYIPQGGDPKKIVQKPTEATANFTIKQQSKNAEYPAPNFPNFPIGLTNKGVLSLSGGETPYTPVSKSEYYERISVYSNRTLIINTVEGDNIIRVKDLDINQGKIVIKGPGRVLLYVDNLIDITGGDMNDTKKAEKFIIYCNKANSYDNKITIGGSTKIYASVYLNKSSITVGGSAQILGDLITAGTSVRIEGSATSGNQVVYAPNARVDFVGSGAFKGSLIGKEIYVEGGEDVQIAPPVSPDFPIIVGSGSSSLQMGEVQYDS
jgi:hypothetical protein